MPLNFPSTGSGQVVSGEEARDRAMSTQRRLAAEGNLAALFEVSSRRNADLSQPAFGPGLNDEPGFLNVAKDIGRGAVDLLSRGNFAAAGFAEELLVNKTGPIAAVGRALRELGSGIGSVQGEKETFRDVLDGLDLVSERRLGDMFSAVDGVPVVGGFNLRGSVGLALDIFLDPLTYLTGGGAALAKVPTAFRTGTKSGLTRLLGVTDDATRGFTKKGRTVRAVQAEEELARIKAAPGEVSELVTEADRLAVESVQESLMSDLVGAGLTPNRAGKISAGAVPDILSSDKAALDAVKRTLDTINPKTAVKVRRSLGLDDAGRASEIGAAIAQRVREKSNMMLRTGFTEAPELSLLAGDIALRRATDSVLELAKTTDPALLRSVAPLRFSLPFAEDIGFNIGPAGKTLTEWVIQSEVSGKAISAIQAVMPQTVLNASVVSAKFVKDRIDATARMLDTQWDTKQLPGFNLMRRATIDGVAYATAKNKARIGQSKVAAWYSSILQGTKKDLAARERHFRNFAVAIDTGQLSKLDGAAREAAEEFNALMRETVVHDVRKGLVKAKDVRRNYFPHFIDHPERIIGKLARVRGRSSRNLDTIGRFSEARSFDTILDIEQAARQLGVDPKINFDPMVALQNRMSASIEGSLYDDFYKAVAAEFGRKVQFFQPEAYEQLVRPVVPVASKRYRLAERLARNPGLDPSPAALDRMLEKHGQDTVGEFLRQKLMNINNFKHLRRFMQKYEGHIEALPRIPGVNEAIEGQLYRPMPTRFKGLRGVEIPDAAAESIERMSVQTARLPEVDSFLGYFDRFQNGLKVYLTALFPAFVFRNAYSNVGQMFLEAGLGALDPRTHIRSTRLAAMTIDDTGRVLSQVPDRYLTPDVRKMAWTEASGREVSLLEAAEELRRNDVVKDSKEIFEGTRVRGRPKKGEVPVEGMSMARKLLSFWRRAGTAANGVVENEARIAMYVRMRQRGLTELEATEQVNRALFDYQDLTEFERTYLKRAIPFYVWTKKNIALQAHAIRNQPGRVANLTKPFNNEDEDVNQTLLDWQAGQFRIQMDRNGKDVRMLTGIDLPIMSIDRLLPIGKLVRGEFTDALKQVTAQMTPFLRAPAELMANETFFDGRSLDRQTSQSIGKLLDPDTKSGNAIHDSVRRWLGYNRTTFPDGKQSYTFEGKKFYLLFKSWHVSRFLTSSDAWFRRASRDSTLAQNFLATMTSLKDQEINLDEAAARKAEERTRQLEQSLVEQGILKRRGSTFELKDSPRFQQQR